MKRGRKTGQYTMEYALYRGDEFVDIGTADVLSNRYGIAIKTIQWLASSTEARKRNIERGYIVLKLGVKGDV